MFCRCQGNLTTKLTDRRPDDDVMRSPSLEQSMTQAEAESGAAVRVERFVRPSLHIVLDVCPPELKILWLTDASKRTLTSVVG